MRSGLDGGAHTTTSASSFCRDTVLSAVPEETSDSTEHSRAELRRVTASPLAAVGRTGWKTSIALAADLLLAVVF